MFSRHREMLLSLENSCFINVLKVQFHDFYLTVFFSICEKQTLSFLALYLPNFQIIEILLPFFLIEYISLMEINRWI